MKFAYADPPYLGQGKLYKKNHPEAMSWDDLLTHTALVRQLETEYSDGWAMSASSPSLVKLLPLFHVPIRVMAWVKPFCAFKPNVNPAYAWEPVVVSGGRRRTREQLTTRDWVSVNITLKKGLTGAKPEPFCEWVLDVLNVTPGDTVDDLFPGTGIFTTCANRRLGNEALR